MRLSGKKTGITVDGTHERFTGTPYSNEVFAIEMDFDFATNLRAKFNAEKEAIKEFGKENVDDKIIQAMRDSKWIILEAIKDWDGIEDELGAELDCTTENKERMFNDPVYKDFFTILVQILTDMLSPSEEEKAADEAMGESLAGADGTTAQVVEEQA